MGADALSEPAREASALSEPAKEASALSESASEKSALSGGSFAVCVYCASSDGIADGHLELAAGVGRGVAERGWTLVTGGGRRSMMGAVSQGARDAGGRTIGVIPRSMVEREWADHDCDELLITDTMRERKAMMDAHADAFITLAGGLGTCEELFETWSARVLELHCKPVVLLDPDGHFGGLLAWLHGVVESGFARRSALDTLLVTTTVDAALDACVGSRPDAAQGGGGSGAPPGGVSGSRV